MRDARITGSAGIPICGGFLLLSAANYMLFFETDIQPTYTADKPTNTYTNPSSIIQLPRIMCTTFQSVPPNHHPKPTNPQFKPPITNNQRAIMSKVLFIVLVLNNVTRPFLHNYGFVNYTIFRRTGVKSSPLSYPQATNPHMLFLIPETTKVKTQALNPQSRGSSRSLFFSPIPWQPSEDLPYLLKISLLLS